MKGTFGTSKEREYFVENLVMLCEAGMDILSALESISSDIRSKRMKEILHALKKSISEGEPIHRALEETNLFKPHIISLIRLGEKSGKLFENLTIVATQQKKERAFHGKLTSALMYPIFIFSISGIVGVAVAWFILPNLANVFAQLKLELPLMTRVLIGIGSFLGHYGIVAIPLFVALLIGMVYLLFFYPKTKAVGQFLIFRFPGLGTMVQEVELARIGYVFGSMLQAGVPILDTIASLRDTAPFYMYKKFYSKLYLSIEQGHSFQKTFLSYQKINALIPTPIQQMIVAGEQSGRLPETFLRIGEIFEDKTEGTTKNIAVILEPILLFIVWAAVIGVAMAVILPIYSLIGGLNR
ncbi:type II secretion system F family protein [Candidatus Uhrbacteria bacterium]|nr:type II secretion system F family protein [Candidatus Uhrbacteria bacterium]